VLKKKISPLSPKKAKRFISHPVLPAITLIRGSLELWALMSPDLPKNYSPLDFYAVHALSVSRRRE
jgi:hypothetical protein